MFIPVTFDGYYASKKHKQVAEDWQNKCVVN
jgi:hypothetical protein